MVAISRTGVCYGTDFERISGKKPPGTVPSNCVNRVKYDDFYDESDYE